MASSSTTLTSKLKEDESQHFSPYRADGKLYGFVCVVTGTTQAIGRAIVHELAAHGAACIYACHDPILEKTTTDIVAEVNAQHANTKVIGYPYGTKEEDTLMLIDDVLNAWGRLDVFATAATHAGPPSLTQTSPTTILQLHQTLTLSPFFALKYAPPAMAKTTPKGNYPNAAPKDVAYGSIIIVTSTASSSGKTGAGVAGTMAAHAALGVVRAGSGELRRTGCKGVRINCVSFGEIGEGGQQEGGKGTGKEVARVVGFLASGFSSHVCGANMVVDGGGSC